MPTYDVTVEEFLNPRNVRLNQLMEAFRGPDELLSREINKMLNPLDDLIRQRTTFEIEMRRIHQHMFPHGTPLDPGLVATPAPRMYWLPAKHLATKQEVAELRARVKRLEQPEQQTQDEMTDPGSGGRLYTGQYL